ncbi:MAG: hypothetical protein LBU90_10340 [Bacteroidales bacterium]|nr:hypothetical protein [Bacteroidales bacterium]
MHYFITTYSTQPKNAKARKAVEFCAKFQHCLVPGAQGFNTIHAEIEHVCNYLNETDTKSRPLTVNTQRDRYIILKFAGDVHNDVIQLSFTKVQSYYDTKFETE